MTGSNAEVVVGASPAPISAATSSVLAHSVVARPALFELLSAARSGGVTLVSAPAGSGKTVLLRSWIEEAGLADCAAWVSVERGERDAQRFWLAVIRELRAAVGADAFVERLTPSPQFDGALVVERLVAELGSLEEPVVLVIDDLHELVAPEALAQLELLLARRPRLLHLVLATRHDPQLGLHRLRLSGELTDVRASDLRFTLEETRELLAASGIALSEESIDLLHTRTEGWVAGLRLAALSLAGHPEPKRFVAEFSGSERTVADYLLAEVLARQPDGVRRLLLRTSVLESMNGALADLLTGASGSERILHALEEANAFVVSLDTQRSWFRYHHLFAALLRLELRRTEPHAVKELNKAAAEWYAQHRDPVAAVRHAQAAEDWDYAARTLFDHALGLYLNGQAATRDALIAAFPANVLADPELILLSAGEPLMRGELDEAAAHISLAERRASAVSPERRRIFEIFVAIARLAVARRRGDFGSVVDSLQSLRALLEEAQTRGEAELRSTAMVAALNNLGIAELWSSRAEEAERHLRDAIRLTRHVEAVWIEVSCLAHLAVTAARRSFAEARDRALEAITIAEAHGWASDPVIGVALAELAGLEAWQGRFEEAQRWLERGEQALRTTSEPATKVLLHHAQGMLHIAQGRHEEAIDAFRAAVELQALLVAPLALTAQVREFLVQTQVRLDDAAAARATLAAMPEEHLERGETRAALASLHLAERNAQAAIDALAPVLDGAAPVIRDFTVVQALLLDAIARDRLGDPLAVESDIERALDLAEPDALIFPFVMIAPRDLLERHPRHRTAHAALLQDILDVLAGSSLSPPAAESQELRGDLSEGELRVVRFLPSNLSAPEIGNELYLSLNTVKTHMRHIYAKLGVHRRTEAVERARELGLLGPSRRRR